jgi:LPXTG-site transpeptidase (sortase) family protein
MEKQKHKLDAPWFITRFPFLVGVIVLTFLLLIALNFSFFNRGVRDSLGGQTAALVTQKFENIKLKPDTLLIPSLNIEAPLVYITGTAENDFQEGLADGVVHYPGTAKVGDPGNSYFFGHSSDLPWSKGKYKTVFEKLPEIKIGDIIYISDNKGVTFAYTATQTHIVQPNETWVLSQFEHKKAMLSLQTSYPVGTAKQRFVVQAVLVTE